MKVLELIYKAVTLFVRVSMTAIFGAIAAIPICEMAYQERGYFAIGGESVLIALVIVLIWQFLTWIFKDGNPFKGKGEQGNEAENK